MEEMKRKGNMDNQKRLQLREAVCMDGVDGLDGNRCAEGRAIKFLKCHQKFPFCY